MQYMRFIAMVTIVAGVVSCTSNKAESILRQARKEAEQIVSDARNKADQIVQKAEQKSNQILKDAEKEAQQIILRKTKGSYSDNITASGRTISLSDLQQIVKEYKDNAVAAEDKYKGRVFVISIDNFDIDAGDQINIKKNLGGIETVWFAMDKGQKDVIASLNKKQTIKILGSVSKYYGSLWFDNCRILEIDN